MLQQTHEDWDPDWIEGSFTGVLRCPAKGCGEDVLLVGRMKVDFGVERGIQYEEFYQLQFAFPALHLVNIPESCPDSVGLQLKQASAVLWSDPGAAATRLRFAIEELMVAQGIPGGVGQANSLHNRIEAYRATHAAAAQSLLAVKWIGNQGTHTASLSVSDVLDGVELLEHALNQIYVHPQLDARAQQVNAQRGLSRGGSAPDPS